MFLKIGFRTYYLIEMFSPGFNRQKQNEIIV